MKKAKGIGTDNQMSDLFRQLRIRESFVKDFGYVFGDKTGEVCDRFILTGTLTSAELEQILVMANRSLTPVQVSSVPPQDGEVVQYVKSVSEGVEILVGQTTGRDRIADSEHVFTGMIDKAFSKVASNARGKQTDVAPAEVFEQIRDATLREIITGFKRRLTDLGWYDSQVVRFVKDHARWLRTDGFSTFFPLIPLAGEDDCDVVAVNTGGGVVNAAHYRLSSSELWSYEINSSVSYAPGKLECHPRIVVRKVVVA